MVGEAQPNRMLYIVRKRQGNVVRREVEVRVRESACEIFCVYILCEERIGVELFVGFR